MSHLRTNQLDDENSNNKMLFLPVFQYYCGFYRFIARRVQVQAPIPYLADAII